MRAMLHGARDGDGGGSCCGDADDDASNCFLNSKKTSSEDSSPASLTYEATCPLLLLHSGYERAPPKRQLCSIFLSASTSAINQAPLRFSASLLALL